MPHWFVSVLAVPRQMRIAFGSLNSIPRWSHETASEYHITWPRRCLPYATFKNERDLEDKDRARLKIVGCKNSLSPKPAQPVAGVWHR